MYTVKNYEVLLPSREESEDEEQELELEIREYLRLKAEDERRRTQNLMNKRNASTSQNNRPKKPEEIFARNRVSTVVEAPKTKSKDRANPQNLISATLLLTDYDDQTGEDAASIFKSCDYQSFGNIQESVRDEKKPKVHNSKITIEKNVFQIVIPGKPALKVCPHCDRSLFKEKPSSKTMREQINPKVPILKEKSHILRRSSKPSALTTKRSYLADLLGTPSNTKDSRSFSRSSIEKPGNYLKPSNKLKNIFPFEQNRKPSNMRSSIDSNSPIFKTMADASIHPDLTDLSHSCMMRSMADKENRKGPSTTKSRVIPSFAKRPEQEVKAKGITPQRNQGKNSYSSKLKR